MILESNLPSSSWCRWRILCRNIFFTWHKFSLFFFKLEKLVKMKHLLEIVFRGSRFWIHRTDLNLKFSPIFREISGNWVNGCQGTKQWALFTWFRKWTCVITVWKWMIFSFIYFNVKFVYVVTQPRRQSSKLKSDFFVIFVIPQLW